jgi:predicted naringenin-chalcone synthase
MYTVLESIGTANPPFKSSQSDLASFMSQIESLSTPIKSKIAEIYSKSGIDYRYICLENFINQPEALKFYPQNCSLKPTPTTAIRNEYYRQNALEIAEKAVLEAMVGIEKTKITHLIVISCTGFSAPGLDIQLIKRLGLSAKIDRTLIGFMGCNAAFNGFKIAHSICQSNTQAVVLLVCVELCSLHFQIEDSIKSVVINTIFADGAAAAIFSSVGAEEAQGKLSYRAGYSLVLEDTMDLMSWTIGDTGFGMELSAEVPKIISKHLPGYLAEFQFKHGLEYSALDFWAIHPGGRKILDRIATDLNLNSALIEDSYEVLRQYGNMSSATILFILKRLLNKHQEGNSNLKEGIVLGFGPGLSIEGCIFQQVY